MFRKMRRIRQQLSDEQTRQILIKSSCGTLALTGDDGYPYAVPISYVFDGEDRIFFHGARAGHKIDAIRQCDKASFCVIDQDEPVSEEFTTYFRSAIAFGKIRIIDDDEELKRLSAELLAGKYSSDQPAESRENEIAKEWSRLAMLELKIEHLTGKEAIELVRNRQAAES